MVEAKSILAALALSPLASFGALAQTSKLSRTRPLCPYPQVARHAGSGSADDAPSFACKAPD